GKELAVVGLPGAVLVRGDGACSVREDAHAGQGKVPLELASQRGPDPANTMGGDARLEEPARGAEEKELLEGELRPAAHAARSLDAAEAGPVPDAGLRGLQNPSCVSCGVLPGCVHAQPLFRRYRDALLLSLAV